jgi:hypothetical protein
LRGFPNSEHEKWSQIWRPSVTVTINERINEWIWFNVTNKISSWILGMAWDCEVKYEWLCVNDENFCDATIRHSLENSSAFVSYPTVSERLKITSRLHRTRHFLLWADSTRNSENLRLAFRLMRITFEPAETHVIQKFLLLNGVGLPIGVGSTWDFAVCRQMHPIWSAMRALLHRRRRWLIEGHLNAI